MQDLNILEVDEKIRTMFQKSKDKVNEYMESLKEVEDMLSKSGIEKIIGKDNKLALENKAKDLRESISSTVNNKEYGYYILQSFQILEKYKEEIKKPMEVFLFKKPSDSKDNDCKEVITSYLNIASDICKLFGIETNTKILSAPEKKTKRIRKSKDRKKAKKKVLHCKKCKSKNLEILGDDGYICQDCFLQVDAMSVKMSSDKMNINTNKYQELDNFKTFMKQFQGKEDIEIRPEVYRFIETKLIEQKLVDDTDVEVNTGTKIKGKILGKITKRHIYNILSKSKWKTYQKNSTFIWVQITGKSAPDLSDIEHVLEEDYRMYINVYNSKKNRTNAPNTQCIFYQLLVKHGIKVNKSEFNFLKEDRLEQYNEISREIFETLGWNYVSIY